ncbi:sulfatase-like hydrolase/transferase [Halorarum salinum]|uniref:Sulfatase-like hydrolase/transferase n=1 Tax=Halorarum salinum TaxID=2743089 RepID=A0A7D5QDM7_9EURY|nr:sulfatase-like hydrolase/transferase [Halobaculum salinum]QLG63400.1 sulfatase-like hydrolase/transferase [Halobaculum salinum]
MNSVILLTVDSLRADRATPDCLSESLNILEKDYTKFENAYSYGVATPFAFPGIIAGTHPEGNGKIPTDATTLAEGIPGESTGYGNNGYLREDRGYAQGFTYFDENPSIDGKGGISFVDRVARRLQKITVVRESMIAKTVYNRYLRDPLPLSSVPADGMTKLVKNALEGESNEFIWGHWMDPHLPYHPETAIDPPEDVPSLEELEDIRDRISAADASALTESELRLSRELYDANVRYYDRYFSNLLSWMKKQHWYDDALIVVVSDHGEYFGEHGQLFHTWDIDPYDEAVHTPLWVKYPGQEDAGDVFNHVVGHGDIIATVADVLETHSLDPPEHTTPLSEESGRHVVSVSNTVKRLKENDGVYLIRRDGSEDEYGEVSEDGKDFAKKLNSPECRNSKGDAIGIEEAERRRRLENLGYR